MAIKRYIMIASLALIAASCSQEEDFAPQHEAEGKPLTVASVSVGEMVVTRSVTTAVTTGTLGIYIDTDNSQQWTYDNSSWELTAESAPIYYKNGMKAAMLHPAPTNATFGEDKVTVTNYGVEQDQSTAGNYAASDLKFSPYAELKSNVIAANLSHALAKVTVNISYGNTLGTVTKTPSVTLSGFKNNATLTIGSDFNVTMAESAAAADITMLKLSEANYTDAGQTKQYDQSFEAIVIPQDVAAKTLAVNITLGEKTYVATLTKDLSFSSGKNHIVDIQVGDNAILIGKVFVEDWTEQNVTAEDTAIQLVKVYQGVNIAKMVIDEKAEAADITEGVNKVANTSCKYIHIVGMVSDSQFTALQNAIKSVSSTSGIAVYLPDMTGNNYIDKTGGVHTGTKAAETEEYICIITDEEKYVMGTNEGVDYATWKATVDGGIGASMIMYETPEWTVYEAKIKPLQGFRTPSPNLGAKFWIHDLGTSYRFCYDPINEGYWSYRYSDEELTTSMSADWLVVFYIPTY